ncbi:MAG: LytTR family DNA-binding domain-containing protein [Eubacteriales bacterium]|nr:LytTR family DNA-binding domain-containing protein [Eubacteriales bacterium]
MEQRVIRTAILDDGEEDRQRIGKIAESYFSERDGAWEVRLFSDSDILLLELAEGKYYDLFFLDVEMPGKNGLEVAREIQRYYPNPVIVYVTDHISYAPEAYEVNAYRYIPKELMERKLPEALGAIVPQIERLDQASYVSEYGGKGIRILYRDFYYVEKDGKYSKIVYRGGVYRERKTLQDIYGQLKGDNFLYLDKSCIVNIYHICSFEKDRVILRDGMELRVSRQRRQAVRDKIMQYWRENL